MPTPQHDPAPPWPVHPIDRAWVSTGGTGAQNYDEFAGDAEITQVIAANPSSALAVEMPHCAPVEQGARRPTFTESLPGAVARLEALKAQGRLRLVDHVLAAYRIRDGGEGAGARPASVGVFAMVDTQEISTSADEPGLVIRNEDVFLDKVRERVDLLAATGHLLSAVLLLQTARASELRAELEAAIAEAGEPAVRDIDQSGRQHEVWLLTGDRAQSVSALAGGGELVVADGNHRSLAAQTAGLTRFLAVITTPDSVRIDPYQRLVTRVPMPVEELLDRLRTAGAEVGPAAAVEAGRIGLYAAGVEHSVRLPAPSGATGVRLLDHSLVEEVLLAQLMGLEPGDKAVRYIGGDYPDQWLRDQVDSGAADLAVLIAPVDVDDFVAVNLAREQMPRKSTWFTPKVRAGLVVAELPEPTAHQD